jgi:predicted DNA-binding ribbon-helix-helix protein
VNGGGNAYRTNIKSERCKGRKKSERCRWRGNTYTTDTKSERCKGMRKSERLEMKFYWDGK